MELRFAKMEVNLTLATSYLVAVRFLCFSADVEHQFLAKVNGTHFQLQLLLNNIIMRENECVLNKHNRLSIFFIAIYLQLHLQLPAGTKKIRKTELNMLFSSFIIFIHEYVRVTSVQYFFWSI